MVQQSHAVFAFACERRKEDIIEGNTQQRCLESVHVRPSQYTTAHENSPEKLQFYIDFFCPSDTFCAIEVI